MQALQYCYDHCRTLRIRTSVSSDVFIPTSCGGRIQGDDSKQFTTVPNRTIARGYIIVPNITKMYHLIDILEYTYIFRTWTIRLLCVMTHVLHRVLGSSRNKRAGRVPGIVITFGTGPSPTFHISMNHRRTEFAKIRYLPSMLLPGNF